MDASRLTDASAGGWAILPDASVVLTLYDDRLDVEEGRHQSLKVPHHLRICRSCRRQRAVEDRFAVREQKQTHASALAQRPRGAMASSSSPHSSRVEGVTRPAMPPSSAQSNRAERSPSRINDITGSDNRTHAPASLNQSGNPATVAPGERQHTQARGRPTRTHSVCNTWRSVCTS